MGRARAVLEGAIIAPGTQVAAQRRHSPPQQQELHIIPDLNSCRPLLAMTRTAGGTSLKHLAGKCGLSADVGARQRWARRHTKKGVVDAGHLPQERNNASGTMQREPKSRHGCCAGREQRSACCGRACRAPPPRLVCFNRSTMAAWQAIPNNPSAPLRGHITHTPTPRIPQP